MIYHEVVSVIITCYYLESFCIFIFLEHFSPTKVNPSKILPPYVTQHIKLINIPISNECWSWQGSLRDIKDATVWRNPCQVSQRINVIYAWCNAANALHTEDKIQFYFMIYYITTHNLLGATGVKSHFCNWKYSMSSQRNIKWGIILLCALPLFNRRGCVIIFIQSESLVWVVMCV